MKHRPAFRLIVALVAAVAFVSAAPVAAQARTVDSKTSSTTRQPGEPTLPGPGAGNPIDPNSGQPITDKPNVCNDPDDSQCNPTEPPPPPIPFCAHEIPYQTSRGDDPTVGRFTFFAWQARQYCRYLSATISGRSLLINRTPGKHYGEVLTAGLWKSASGYEPAFTSDAAIFLYDLSDIDESPTLVEIALETVSTLATGTWESCNPMSSGVQYLRCDGLHTSTVHVTTGTGAISTRKPNPFNEAVRKTPNGGVALTFDDGPRLPYTDQVLDLLRDNGIKATFCVLGTEARKYPDQIRRIVNEGHTLCNHANVHDGKLGQAGPAAIEASIVETNQAIRAAAPGARIPYFRHPEGGFTRRSNEVVRRLGMTPLFWDVDPEDYNRPGTDAIVRFVTSQTKSNSIVLLHDAGGDRSQTVEALRTIIPDLKSRYTLIPMP